MALNNLKLLFVGLPNTGKTTLFNQLTGANHKTGNWSGVTIATSHQNVSCLGRGYELIDTPGILSVYDEIDQMDYQLSRQELMRADILVNVVDARFLQRDMVLGLQLRFYEKPMITVVTGLQSSHLTIDNIKAVLPGEVLLAEELTLPKLVSAIEGISPLCIMDQMEWPIGFGKIWQSLGDMQPLEKLKNICQLDEGDVLIAEGFYQTAATLIDKGGCRKASESQSFDLDSYVLHPFWGGIIFLTIIYFIFAVTVNLGSAFGDFMSGLVMLGFGYINNIGIASTVLQSVGSGLATGVSFLPILAIIYGFLNILEQSGYLSRVVLLTDGLLTKFGLSGHAFIPMVLGFGCNVSAIMAARTGANTQQRQLTALLMPFISCSARLSIFVIFAGEFFPQRGGLIVLGLYLLGIFLGFATVGIMHYLNSAVYDEPLSVQLPRYQIPQMSLMLKSVWLRLRGFMNGAMKQIIIIASIFALLASVDFSMSVAIPSESVLAIASQSVAPLFGFMGLDADSWPAIAALFSGLVAKETVITTLNALGYMSGAVSDPISLTGLLIELGSRLLALPVDLFTLGEAGGVNGSYAKYFSQSSALAYMVFILLYFPCISTLVVMASEYGKKLAMVSFVWTTVLAIWFAKMTYHGISHYDIALLLSAILAIKYYRGYCDATTG